MDKSHFPTATRILRDDHKRLEGLFRQYEAIGSRAPEMKQGVVREIFMELEVHSKIEEDIFYPAFELVTDTEGQALIAQSLEDHDQVSQKIIELKDLEMGDEELDSRLAELISDVEDHMEREETELLPRAERILWSEMEKLGIQMEKRQAELMASPEYDLSRPETVQNPHGGEQMRKNKAA